MLPPYDNEKERCPYKKKPHLHYYTSMKGRLCQYLKFTMGKYYFIVLLCKLPITYDTLYQERKVL